MQLSQTRALLPKVIWLDSTASTNSALRDLVQHEEPLPHGTLVVTDHQTAGRGRQGRDWQTPAHTALAASLLVRDFGAGGLGIGWLPLLAGSAVSAALTPCFAEVLAVNNGRVGVKWPNDVHLSNADPGSGLGKNLGPKLSGVLCELQSDGSVIVGVGINVLIPPAELPTGRAGSVLASGGEVRGAQTFADPAGAALADEILARTASQLLELVALACEDPVRVRNRVIADSVTLNQDVTVHLPSGEAVAGRAVSFAHDGSLVVSRVEGGSLTVSAGDVEHLR